MNSPENAVTYLVIAYSVSSFVRLYFYVPQIKSVVRSNDASAIHVPTWMVWTGHNVISAAYGWFVTNDLQFAMFFVASAICTSLIGTIAAKKQRSVLARVALINDAGSEPVNQVL